MLKKRSFTRSVAALAMLIALISANRTSAAEDFSLLVYNTHGLPSWIAGDDPETRFPIIGGHADRYDLTLLQEDFNHHEKLLEGTAASVVVRGSESRMPWCAFCSGDGLTTISRLPEDWQLTIEKYPFDTCSGWLSGANDCMATKGFQLLHLTTPQGGRLFVVNTHMDAGDGDGDRKARAAQLETIRTIVEKEVGNHALLVAGDLNLDASNPLDQALLNSFMESLGLVESGAHPTAPTDWEILDYILLRSGPEVHITVNEAGEDRALIHNGAPLSDHPALFARFSVQGGSQHP